VDGTHTMIGVGHEELLRRYQAEGGRSRAATAGQGAVVVPSQHTVVITCMDARIDPGVLFGLKPGDAHVLRNAGGLVTEDVLRSLAISQRKLGTREVLVVQHSRCGLASFTDDEFSEELNTDVGMRPSWRAGTFTDPATSVRRGMARIRRDPFLLKGTTVRGFVLDIDGFGLTEVYTDESQEDAPIADV
jgi:carbonic anhydrase